MQWSARRATSCGDEGEGQGRQAEHEAEDPEPRSGRGIAAGRSQESRQSLAFHRQVDDAEHQERQAGNPGQQHRKAHVASHALSLALDSPGD